MFLQLLIGVIDVLIGLVLQVNHALALSVRLLSGLSLLDHSLNVGVRETTAGSDGNILCLSSGLVFGAYVQDAVSIDVKGHFDLWVAAGCHRDALKFEVSKLLVVLCELTLTLQNGDAYLGLIVGGRGEDLALLGRNRRVSVNQSGENASHGFDTKRQRGNIEQKDVLDITSQNCTLDCSTNSNCFVWVHRLVGLLAKEVLDKFLDLGDSR